MLGLVGPSLDALGDGWEEDGLQRLASGSDCGQGMGRKGSASLPLHLQPQLLQDFRRKGSASLPTFWGYPDARESLLSRSGSMPGKAFLLAVMCGAQYKSDWPLSDLAQQLEPWSIMPVRWLSVI